MAYGTGKLYLHVLLYILAFYIIGTLTFAYVLCMYVWIFNIYFLHLVFILFSIETEVN